MGPLRNISFEVGIDANTENRYFGGMAKRDVVAGLQFAFDLPYKGYFNVAPLVYWEFANHNSFAQCGAGWTVSNVPGQTCSSPTATPATSRPGRSRPTTTWTWASCARRAVLLSQRPARDGTARRARIPSRLPFFPANQVFNRKTKVEFNSEPIRLTLDASKAVWGPKYSHFVDVWVAYRYWQNKFGLDHNAPSIACFSYCRRRHSSKQRGGNESSALFGHHGKVLTASPFLQVTSDGAAMFPAAPFRCERAPG